jgi:hypothetical protein
MRSAMQLAAGARAAKKLREFCSSCMKTPNFHSRLVVEIVKIERWQHEGLKAFAFKKSKYLLEFGSWCKRTPNFALV